MKAIKLTEKQRELFEQLKANEGGCLYKHLKMTNTVCFHLLDKDKNPIKNYGCGTVYALIDKDILELKGFSYVLKATSDNQPKVDYSKVGLQYNPAL